MSDIFVLEGPDEVGKTTLVSAVSDYLAGVGRKNITLAFPGKEAGTLGRHIYELHHVPDKFGIRSMAPLSLQLLHVAAHIDSIENRILPAIAAGSVILLDRFWWSTWVYGRMAGIPVESLHEILAPEHRAWNGVQPTVLFLLSRQGTSVDSRLVDAYEELRQIETTNYDIVQISNDAGIAELATRVGNEILDRLGAQSHTEDTEHQIDL